MMGRMSLRETILADPRGQRKGKSETETIRSFHDLICQRLHWLEGRDRLLIELVYVQNTSCRQIAKLTGLSETTVSRRIQKLTRGLLSKTYQLCIQYRFLFSDFQMTLARQRFVQGLSRREIARRHRVSLYHVDHQLRTLRNRLRNQQDEFIHDKICSTKIKG